MSHSPKVTDHHLGWEGGALPSSGMVESTVKPEERHARLHGPPVSPVEARAPAKSYEPMLRQVCLSAWVALFSILGYYLISRYVITAVEIQGRSMAPTLQEGERYFLNRLAYYWQSPARGDLAVIHDPGHPDWAVKRIIGLPGDLVMIKDGYVLVNGRRLDEPYLLKGTRTQTAKPQGKPVFLGPNQYFLLGDNRAQSEDSRSYGPIHRSQILGLISK